MENIQQLKNTINIKDKMGDQKKSEIKHLLNLCLNFLKRLSLISSKIIPRKL